MLMRFAVVFAAVALVTGCAGVSAYESCVAHSVEEGVDRAQAETACREAGFEY